MRKKKLSLHYVVKHRYDQPWILQGYDEYRIKPDAFVAIKKDGNQDLLPIYKHSRKELIEMIQLRLLELIKNSSPRKIYTHLNFLARFKYDGDRIHNYQIEDDYLTLTHELGHVIDEPCPRNGRFSAYGDLHNLIRT